MHASKNQEMKNDLNSILASSDLTVDKMLRMNWTDFVNTNANEVMWTGQTGFGKEWVETEVIVAELLARIENSESLLSLATRGFPDIDKILFPVNGKRVRMIMLEENKDQPQNKTLTEAQIKKVSTPLVEVNAKEFVITVYVSDKLMRQSVVNIANYIMDEIVKAYENTAHEIILNGDTKTGTGNINIIDWNTSALPWWAKSDLLAFDWARKVAIDKGATVDAQNNLELSVIRKARAKMGIKWVNPGDVVMVVEQNAYFDLLNLSEVETMEKFGASATVKDWVLASIDWMKIIPREELGLTLANWTISATEENNVYSQIALIHTPSLLAGNTYGLTTELSRYAEEKTTGMTGSVWFAMWWNDEQNNNRATSPVALIVNINSTEEESV